VGYAEKDARKTVRPLAATGGEKYLAAARITWAANSPRGRGPVGTAIRTRKMRLCRDTQTDPDFAPWRAGARRFGFGSVIALPLLVDGECVGALCIYAPELDAFDAAEQLLLTDLANDLAFGIGTMRLRAERERLEDEILKSTEREQERIGRDLHDGLGQLLTGAKFRAAYLAKIGRDEFPALRREARALEDILNQAIAQTRDLVRGLNPVKVTADGLAAALQQLADNAASTHDLHCFFQSPERVPIADHHVAYHLYRIAQEAVQNALKHARAKSISITLTRRDGRLLLAVKDDGEGIPRLRMNGGMGLNNMQIRARLVGSRLEIRRRRHGGTEVLCELAPKP
jgi:signal transduction histidine kinase